MKSEQQYLITPIKDQTFFWKNQAEDGLYGYMNELTDTELFAFFESMRAKDLSGQNVLDLKKKKKSK